MYPNEEYFKQFPRGTTGRGGYQEGLSYDGLTIRGNHFHFVFDHKGRPNPSRVGRPVPGSN
jgi:hypothetical protein